MYTVPVEIDLHTHTNCSDGELAPLELLAHAAESGVSTISITDHDTLDAYKVSGVGQVPGTRVVPGIELSTHWRNITVHVVGLNFRLHDDAITTAVTAQRRARDERAVQIAEKLARLGIRDALPRVRQIAGDGLVGRPHFAQFLVETGVVKSSAQAFKKFLGSGKSCDIKIGNAALNDVIGWVRDAGGTSVLAHPSKYGLTHTKLDKLVTHFRLAGGQALEVVSGLQRSEVTGALAALCSAHKLSASCGSDFHARGQKWAALGRFPALPDCCMPVWESW